MSKLLIVIIVAVLIGTAIFWINNQSRSQNSSPSPNIKTTTSNTLKTYTNPNYQDSFSYPGDYTLNSEYPNYLLLKKPSAPQYDWTFKVDTYQNPEKTDFVTFIESQLLSNCAADGPNGSQSCDKITRQEPFTTDSGIAGYAFYLNKIYTSKGQTTNSEIGPYYVFDISKQTDNKAQAIFFYPANFVNLTTSSPEDAAVLESMAKSLKFN